MKASESDMRLQQWRSLQHQCLIYEEHTGRKTEITLLYARQLHNLITDRNATLNGCLINWVKMDWMCEWISLISLKPMLEPWRQFSISEFIPWMKHFTAHMMNNSGVLFMSIQCNVHFNAIKKQTSVLLFYNNKKLRKPLRHIGDSGIRWTTHTVTFYRQKREHYSEQKVKSARLPPKVSFCFLIHCCRLHWKPSLLHSSRRLTHCIGISV